MLAAATLAAAAIVLSGGRGNESDSTESLVVGYAPELTIPDASVGSDRPIYRHSVVPGGVYTPDELRDALALDAVVAAHYTGLDANAIRADIVTRDRFAYVSYRKNDRIYWTRNKVLLTEGETILTDGASQIRARCGNCISDTPMLPVAESEPDPVEFDRLVDESEPANAGEPSLAAAVGPLGSDYSGPGGFAAPGGFAGGPAGGAGGPVGGASASGETGVPPGASIVGEGPRGGGSFPAGFPGLAGPSFGGPAGFPGVGPSSVPSPGGPTSGEPFTESPFVPPGTTPWLPPGVIPPPGFSPPPGFGPPPPDFSPLPESEPIPPGSDQDDGPGGGSPDPVSVPEPGTILLVGGGAAAALFRKLRAQR